MENVGKLQSFITRLAHKHGFDLDAPLEVPRGVLRLEMEGYPRLVINHTEPNFLWVSSIHEGEFEPEPDPLLLLFLRRPKWIPLLLCHRIEYGNVYARLTSDGTDVVIFDPAGQAQVEKWCQQWAEELEAQGWLENGRRRN